MGVFTWDHTSAFFTPNLYFWATARAFVFYPPCSLGTLSERSERKLITPRILTDFRISSRRRLSVNNNKKKMSGLNKYKLVWRFCRDDEKNIRFHDENTVLLDILNTGLSLHIFLACDNVQ